MNINIIIPLTNIKKIQTKVVKNPLIRCFALYALVYLFIQIKK